MLKHIVLWKIHKDGTKEQKLESYRAFKEKTRYLQTVIPEIVKAEVAYNLNEDGFDICIDSVFGSREDLEAMEYAMNCGCRLIATIHGASMDDIRQKPVLGRMVKERWFERYVVLDGGGRPGKAAEIYDGRGTRLFRKEEVW